MKKQVSKENFTIDKMPHNRKEVFFDILKNRFSTLLLIGLTILISALPMIICFFYVNIEGANIANSSLSEEEIASSLISLEKMKYLLFLISSIFLTISLSGSSAVIQKLIWQEGFLFKTTYKKGIKENYPLFLISYLSLFILIYILALLIYNNSNDIVKGISIGALVLYASIINLTTSQAAIYKLPLYGYFKNGFVISMASFLKTLLCLIINVVFLLLFLIPSYIFQSILIIVLPLFIAPLLILGNTLYANYIFDNFINKDKYPEIYDKGVYRVCQK